MKLRVEWNQRSYLLDTAGDSYSIRDEATGETRESGLATIAVTRPGAYAVLFADGESIQVNAVPVGGSLEVLAGDSRYTLAFSDPRDRKSGVRSAGAHGPVEVRSQMPGKIIKVLVKEGQEIEEGDGLFIVEAMKMQNETRSPKAGVVQRVHVAEGATVAAGELLALVV